MTRKKKTLRKQAMTRMNLPFFEAYVHNKDLALIRVRSGFKRLVVYKSLEGNTVYGTPEPIDFSAIHKHISENTKYDVELYVYLSNGKLTNEYREDELSKLEEQIKFFKNDVSVKGFVFSALKMGELDQICCDMVIKAAHPLPVTFGDARNIKDLVDNKALLENIIALRFSRIITVLSPIINVAPSELQQFDLIAMGRIDAVPLLGENDMAITILPLPNIKEYCFRSVQINFNLAAALKQAFYDGGVPESLEATDDSDVEPQKDPDFEEFMCKMNEILDHKNKHTSLRKLLGYVKDFFFDLE